MVKLFLSITEYFKGSFSGFHFVSIRIVSAKHYGMKYAVSNLSHIGQFSDAIYTGKQDRKFFSVYFSKYYALYDDCRLTTIV